MLFERSVSFDADAPDEALCSIPEVRGVFALFPRDARDQGLPSEPYISKTTNLRRRISRLLGAKQAAVGSPSKRLRLARKIARIEFGVTGSEFESQLALYAASFSAFGKRARHRLHLRPAVFLRMSVENPYPRVYVTTQISRSRATSLFGPFQSRAEAERYSEAVLDLFLLRRCVDNLHPDPAFPGCPYSEMKMCLAPCFEGCTDERYRQEADAVLNFLSTRGRSLLLALEAERDAASAELDFEKAGAIHRRIEKARSAADLASGAVHSLASFDAILVQPAAEPGDVALFRIRGGIISGPAPYSTVGIRLAKEHSGSSSLFPQPFAPEPIPLDSKTASLGASLPAASGKDLLERRLDEAFAHLESESKLKSFRAPPSQTLADHMALFTRWFYRPASRRVGEVVFVESGGEIPRKALLRSISRVAAPRSEISARQP